MHLKWSCCEQIFALCPVVKSVGLQWKKKVCLWLSTLLFSETLPSSLWWSEFLSRAVKKWKLYKGFNLYKELSVKLFMMQLYKKYDNTTNNGKLFALV